MKKKVFLLLTFLFVSAFWEIKASIAQSHETSRKNFYDLQEATTFRKWADWYPVDFGQPIGSRMINRWDSTTKPNPWMHGHSSLHVGNNLPTLPTTYNSNSMDYFFFWQCPGRIGEQTDPNCYDQSIYREIISQGAAYDPVGKTTLEHWARGSSTNWEVYYDPSVIGFTNCDGNGIKNTGLDLNRADFKKPWVLKLPQAANSYYVSDPICTLVFNGYSQDKNNVIDSRYSQLTPDFDTGNWISLTITHDVFKDNLGFDIIYAENIYLIDNTKASDRFTQRYCNSINLSDTLRCVNENGQRVGLAYTKDGRLYRTFAFEEYWVRKTTSSGRYGNVIDRYGFGSFHYWSSSVQEWDQVRNDGSSNSGDGSENQQWILESCQLDQRYNIIQCLPSLISPTPTPTPLLGDLNHDGRVDILDLRQILANFTNIFDYNILVGNLGK